MFNNAGEKSPAKITKIMKKQITYNKTQLERVCTEQGESIEEMVRRLTANKQPIPDEVPPIYTPKADGVLGDYDIRQDRFDTAYEATDKFTASQIAKSANAEELDEAEAKSYEPAEQTEQTENN